ncbi:ethylene-responsive transcription factor Related to AP22-12-like [Forsythia ovata]|uniref:Ethylene-responsive transcription factor Related to AP22-12-like n=1 Tax=Forsythia ovata TaxID=205694 RepID=A0ABD1W799_9LAMI
MLGKRTKPEICGGAIISDLLAPNRLSRRLTADLLWGSGSGADLINSKKKVPRNCHSKLSRSKPVVDIDDDFDADFQEFKDYSDDEVEINEDARAYDTEARRIRGKKVKVNFLEHAPVSASKHVGKVNPCEGLHKESSDYVQPSVN